MRYPYINDTVTGQLSGDASTIYEVEYNDRETLSEIIEYIQKTYLDIHIVTIDEGLVRIMPLKKMTK
jgi:hypothetical protein